MIIRKSFLWYSTSLTQTKVWRINSVDLLSWTVALPQLFVTDNLSNTSAQLNLMLDRSSEQPMLQLKVTLTSSRIASASFSLNCLNSKRLIFHPQPLLRHSWLCVSVCWAFKTSFTLMRAFKTSFTYIWALKTSLTFIRAFKTSFTFMRAFKTSFTFMRALKISFTFIRAFKTSFTFKRAFNKDLVYFHKGL